MPRNKRTQGLKRTLGLYLIPAAITTCLLISWMVHSVLGDGLRAENEKQIDNVVMQASYQINSVKTLLQSDTNYFAKSPALISMLEDVSYLNGIKSQRDILGNFKQLQNSEREYREMYLIAPDGEVVFSHADNIFHQVAADRLWLNELTSSKSPVRIIDGQTGLRLAAASPIVHPKTGSIIGYVVLTQDASKLDAIVNSLSAETGLKIALLRENGSPLNELSDLVRRGLYAIQANPKESLYYLDNSPWFGKLSGNSLGKVFILKNAAEFQQKLVQLRWQIYMASALVTLIFSIMLGWLVSKLVLTPIQRLGDAANDLAKGREGLIPERDDEIGALGSAILSMANALRHSNARAQKLAFFDELTGLHNNAAYLEHIRQFTDPIDTQDTIAITLDIEGFKRINDIHGYHTGNKLLRAVAQRIEDSIYMFAARHGIAESNFVTARGAADKFMIFACLPANSSQHLPLALTGLILKQVKNPITIEAHEHVVSCYIGWERGGNSGFEVYEKADMALHEAKSTKTPMLRFSGELLERTRRNQELSDSITRALDNDEFTLYYQPKCTVQAPHTIVEYEALIRWPTENGFISPGEFIPFAEEANFIGSIDLWVCKRVILDIAEMYKCGMSDFVVSFNVSAKRLSDNRFVDFLKQAVESGRVKPQHLQIEITEHSLIGNTKAAVAVISELRRYGITVALDDFGTGHSSLGYLNELPIRTLKIDRCFVRDVHKDRQRQTLLKHIIALGQDMGLQIVAEGVEGEDELSILQELGCDLVQGFLFYRPMPLDSLLDIYQTKAA